MKVAVPLFVVAMLIAGALYYFSPPSPESIARTLETLLHEEPRFAEVRVEVVHTLGANMVYLTGRVKTDHEAWDARNAVWLRKPRDMEIAAVFNNIDSDEPPRWMEGPRVIISEPLPYPFASQTFTNEAGEHATAAPCPPRCW